MDDGELTMEYKKISQMVLVIGALFLIGSAGAMEEKKVEKKKGGLLVRFKQLTERQKIKSGPVLQRSATAKSDMYDALDGVSVDNFDISEVKRIVENHSDWVEAKTVLKMIKKYEEIHESDPNGAKELASVFLKSCINNQVPLNKKPSLFRLLR